MDIQLTQILFQIINFGVVAGALTFFLYKPVLKIFDERAKRIEEGQKAASEALETREELEKTQNSMQTRLKKERAKILEESQEEAKKRSQEIIAAAKKEAKAEVEKLKEQWADEKSQLINEAKEEMTDAVLKAAGLVINENLDSKKQQQLAEAELTKLLKQI